MIRFRLAGPALGLALLAACTTPAPVAKPVPTVAPPPVPVAVTPPRDWRDAPLTAGTWRYVPGTAQSYAVYGAAGAQPALVIACDKTARTIAIMRQGAATSLTVTTSYGAATLPAGGLSHDGKMMTGARISARDNLLDRIGYSRGRFAVMGAGLAPVIVPAWAEPARAVEDCRQAS
ncbi:hypothetical protein [Sphingomonas crocodyli]|uniref:DUF2846 domain-containing protein n=1 Tax=Sphingomonas crocodyli TaxID=1979270 RepID=A0A437M7Z9_9SPHN|nr:hypothetical protein [Sphingomonas crocodyli]RVT93840.1 hypothetical protein EOD43_08250 [Sphingomonas crocodyli]